ncbi:MAG: cytochrome c3 family protein [Desulfovibrio sp.]|jgi:opacity protein-like surface antigen|nr:cytochrome c3 family protein [Desulfovibrio sp.]
MKTLTAAIALCLSLAAAAAATDTVPEAPQNPSELNWTSRAVIFSHKTHFAAFGGNASMLCALCHHRVEGAIPYKTCATPDCHDNLNKADTSVKSYHQALHKTEDAKYASCVSCHTKKAQGDDAGIKRLAGCQESVCHN